VVHPIASGLSSLNIPPWVFAVGLAVRPVLSAVVAIWSKYLDPKLVQARTHSRFANSLINRHDQESGESDIIELQVKISDLASDFISNN
jgi:hypothetical protein